MKRHTTPQQKEIWISGINPVKEALSSTQATPRELLTARTDARGAELEEAAARRGIPVTRGSREKLTELTGHTHHQGVALRIQEYHYLSLEELLGRPPADREPLVIADSIQDPQNLGALLRSACFLGAKAVIIPADRSAKVTAAVMKAAAGAASYIPCVQVTNLSRAIHMLKDAGIWVAGLDAEAEQSIHDSDLTVPLALVVGSEQKGIRRLVRTECDFLVKIPAHCPMESLNAAAAGAVALAEVQRQRSRGRPA